VIAHEFEHLIHWKYDENETSWVDEGMAELAMYFFGHPDNISAVNSSPDNDLTQWDGDWADYIQTYLWTLYFFERYGGHETIYAVVHERANSMAGYDAVLDQFGYTENTGDVFSDWTVANFLDDTSIADGRYGSLLGRLKFFATVARVLRSRGIFERVAILGAIRSRERVPPWITATASSRSNSCAAWCFTV
jgi:hypothetical protein